MSDLSGLLLAALRELSAAIKATAFYPAQHPAVVAALDRLAATFREALALVEAIKVGVGEAVFLHDGKPLGAGDPMLSRFATYLSRRGIGALVFRSPLQHESLRGLLDVLVLDPAAVRERGGPAHCLAERRVGGVALEEFDPALALRSAGTADPSRPEAADGRVTGLSVNDLVARFLTGGDDMTAADAADVLRSAARDEQATRELVRSIQTVARGAAQDGGPIVTAALGRMAGEVAALDPGAIPTLATNLGTALQDLDPEARMSVLQASIPIGETGLDLAREIRSRIPAERLGEMIVSLVQSQQRLNPRLTSVVRKVRIDRQDAEQGQAAIRDAIQKARQPDSDPLSDVWTSMESLLEETQDEWISRDYKGLLEMIGSETPALEDALRREILALPGFGEALSEAGIQAVTWLVFADLLELESDPDLLRRLLEEIGRRAAAIDPDWYGAAAESAATVRLLTEAEPPIPPPVGQAAVAALQAIAGRVVGSYSERFHDLTAVQKQALPEVLAALGSHGIEPLIAGLQVEEDWEVRKTFITFLIQRGREVVPALLRRLTDPSWYLVRNMLVILGEIGDPSTVAAIAATLDHQEPRVRRDAVVALGKIGGPRAFALVRQCLQDEQVSEVATRCLAAIDHGRTVATFLQITDRVNLIGRGNDRVKEAIKTLGVLGAHESIPRLRAILSRNLWLPPSAGDPVRIAAALALEKIGTAEALQAVDNGARSWRYPVRSVCAAIVEGRQNRPGLQASG